MGTARNPGSLTGTGIDTKDKAKNGDEDKSGRYTGGKGGNYEIVCNEPTSAQDEGKTAMENRLAKTKDINLVYTINEPAAGGAEQALKDAGVTATIVSVDGACNPGLELVKSGAIGATSQQYPLKMAQLGVEAIAKIARGGEKPAVAPGSRTSTTPVFGRHQVIQGQLVREVGVGRGRLEPSTSPGGPQSGDGPIPSPDSAPTGSAGPHSPALGRSGKQTLCEASTAVSTVPNLQQDTAATSAQSGGSKCAYSRMVRRERRSTSPAPPLCKQGVRGSSPLGSTL